MKSEKLNEARLALGRCFTIEDFNEFLANEEIKEVAIGSVYGKESMFIARLFRNLMPKPPRQVGDYLYRQFRLPHCETLVLSIEFFDGQVFLSILGFLAREQWALQPVPESEWLDCRLPLLQEAIAKLQEFAFPRTK